MEESAVPQMHRREANDKKKRKEKKPIQTFTRQHIRVSVKMCKCESLHLTTAQCGLIMH